MTNYFDLHWLGRLDKDIHWPLIVYTKTEEYGGCYVYPANEEEVVDGKYYSLNKGLIIVSLLNDNNHPNFIINTIAHEWRHHYQYYKGWYKYRINRYWNECEKYQTNIINYFNRLPQEMDAFLFSLKRYPDEVTLEWYEWLIKEHEEKHDKQHHRRTKADNGFKR